MRTVKKIVLHYSATPSDRDVTAKEINEWHKARGFRMIGYHYVVRLDGTVEQGRPEEIIGAHVKGHNSNSIGVCYIGGLKGNSKKGSNTMTEAQEASVIGLIQDLLQRYPQSCVYGHRDLTATQCPGFDVSKWWKKVS